MAYYNNNYPGGQPSGFPAGQPPGSPGGQPALCPGDGGCGGGLCLVINGITQVLLGVIAIILGAVTVESGILGEVEQIYIPIWAGCIFFLAGLIGIFILCCNGNPGDQFLNKCMVGIFLAMCIVAGIAAIGLIGWEGWIASEFGRYKDSYCLFTGFTGGFAGIFDVGCADYERVYYLRTSAAIIGGVEVLAAIIGSVIACMRLFNRDNRQANPMIVQQSPYGQSPPPYAQSSPYFGQYGQDPSVYYNGQAANYQPGGFMYR